jgi:hypothetical protein
MPRIRTIQPNFARSPSMSRVTRDARLMFVLLWTIVDDEGRCHDDPALLADVLYPHDFDVERHLPVWLDELEGEGCVERYAVDGVDYLRIVHWHQHQHIDHPTASLLPPSPHERMSASRLREASRRIRGPQRKAVSDQRLGEGFETIREAADFSKPLVVTPELILEHLERLRLTAEAEGSIPNALRSVAMMAQIGLPPAKSKKRRGEPREPERTPSPAEIHGLIDYSRNDD